MTLIFVYNADSGPIHGLKDMLHKLVSPSTYECNLCAVTYTTFGMKAAWRDFIAELPHDVLFLHRDELQSRHGTEGFRLPAAFIEQDDGTLDIWIDAASLSAVDSLAALQSLIMAKLAEISAGPTSTVGHGD